MEKNNKEYAIYNMKDELLAVGTLKECAIDLGMKYNSLVQKKNRQFQGRPCRKYKIVVVEDV